MSTQLLVVNIQTQKQISRGFLKGKKKNRANLTAARADHQHLTTEQASMRITGRARTKHRRPLRQAQVPHCPVADFMSTTIKQCTPRNPPTNMAVANNSAVPRRHAFLLLCSYDIGIFDCCRLCGCVCVSAHDKRLSSSTIYSVACFYKRASCLIFNSPSAALVAHDTLRRTLFKRCLAGRPFALHPPTPRPHATRRKRKQKERTSATNVVDNLESTNQQKS